MSFIGAGKRMKARIDIGEKKFQVIKFCFFLGKEMNGALEKSKLSEHLFSFKYKEKRFNSQTNKIAYSH